MSLTSNIAPDIKRNVRAVLLSKVGGVPMSNFLSDYKSLLGVSLNFKEFGFSSLQDFIKSMPDAARLENKDTKIVIFGVGEPNSYMPIGARKAQGKLPKNYHKNLQLETQEQQDNKAPCVSSPVSEMNIETLEPDDRGLYSVCMPLEKCPTLNVEELEVIFGQAGKVQRTYHTERWMFIRYTTPEHVFKAKELFGDEYDLRIAQNKKKEKTDTSGKSGRRQHDLNSSDDKEEKKNSRGNSKGQMGRGKNKTLVENGVFKSSKTTKGSQEAGTALFAGNIESEDDFRAMIEPYGPENIRILSGQGRKLYGFVKMKNAADAKRAIEDLNQKIQTTKPLLLDYDKGRKSGPDKSSPKSETNAEPQGARFKKKALAMPPLERDLSDMPPLVHETMLGPDAEDFYLDCSIFVGNFPANTLESTLRGTFSKYNVLDICMVNNGSGQGCTKAFLYLATVYDVINAVREMNSSCVLGYPLKVDVPFTNQVLKTVVNMELLK